MDHYLIRLAMWIQWKVREIIQCHVVFRGVLPGSLTVCPLKGLTHPKRKVVFQPSSFFGSVCCLYNFRGVDVGVSCSKHLTQVFNRLCRSFSTTNKKYNKSVNWSGRWGGEGLKMMVIK